VLFATKISCLSSAGAAKIIQHFEKNAGIAKLGRLFFKQLLHKRTNRNVLNFSETILNPNSLPLPLKNFTLWKS
jgi:hypothetical protein